MAFYGGSCYNASGFLIFLGSSVGRPACRQAGRPPLFWYDLNMYYVYVIKSEKDNSLYKGITNSLSRRLKEHNLGKNQSTKSKIPYVLVYHETVDNRMKAREREKWFKSGEGREFLRKIILEK